jgi:subtilisin-like proprotein convertase family protein
MKSRILINGLFTCIILIIISGSGSAESMSELPVITANDWGITSSEPVTSLAALENVPANPADWNWDIEVVDESTDDIGEYPSLALDSNGDPHISYSDTHNEYLMYAQLRNGTWYLNPLDQTSGAG